MSVVVVASASVTITRERGIKGYYRWYIITSTPKAPSAPTFDPSSSSHTVSGWSDAAPEFSPALGEAQYAWYCDGTKFTAKLDPNDAHDYEWSAVSRDSDFEAQKQQSLISVHNNAMWAKRQVSGIIPKNSVASVQKIYGNTVIWNQPVLSTGESETVTITLASGHKYIVCASSTKSIVNGTGQTRTLTVGSDWAVDMTVCFGAGNEPSSVSAFETLFPEAYYMYSEKRLLDFTADRVSNGRFTLAMAVGEFIASNGSGLRSVGNTRDELELTQYTKWIDVREYQAGDESDTSVLTDGVHTNFILPTPLVTTFSSPMNMTYSVARDDTEQIIVHGNGQEPQTAPIIADIDYLYDGTGAYYSSSNSSFLYASMLLEQADAQESKQNSLENAQDALRAEQSNLSNRQNETDGAIGSIQETQKTLTDIQTQMQKDQAQMQQEQNKQMAAIGDLQNTTVGLRYVAQATSDAQAGFYVGYRSGDAGDILENAHLRMTGDKLEFVVGEKSTGVPNVVAYMSSEKLYIGNAQVTNELQLGEVGNGAESSQPKWSIKSRLGTDGYEHLSIRWIG